MRLLIAFLFAIFLLCPSLVMAEFYERGRQMVSCHRTANRDVPENTLESLEESALLGCDIVEIDIRKTLDGELMLLHDGPIDRVSTGTGDVERMLSEEFALYDAGSWMSPRFAGLRHPRFDEALRLARRVGLKLSLDLKTVGITREVYEMTKAEGMIDRVRFGGTARDIREIDPTMKSEKTASWLPGMTKADVDALRAKGLIVTASFSANNHELDLTMMREAVAAGVDVINTDHPRLASDVVGRPVEKKALELRRAAESGASVDRAKSLLELARFRDFDLTAYYVGMTMDADPIVSRAAAVALVKRARPDTVEAILSSSEPKNAPAHVRANQAWTIGMLSAQADEQAAQWLLSLLEDPSAETVREALFALARWPSPVRTERVRPLLDSESGLTAGAAALALARHDPDAATRLIPPLAERLREEIHKTWRTYAEPPKPATELSKGRTTFERPEPGTPRREELTARATDLYSGYQKTLAAAASLPSAAATAWLHGEMERHSEDFAGFVSYIAGYQLWDRGEPDRLGRALESNPSVVRDRAEWALIKHGVESGPALRRALASADRDTRLRAAQALGWLGDSAAVPLLQKLENQVGEDAPIYAWAQEKIAQVRQIVDGR
jgi:glycerophosphoryl diester phosphodiesterase